VSSPDKLSLHNLYSHKCPDCGGHIERLSISETENTGLQKAFNKAVRWIFREKKTSINSGDIDNKAVQPLLTGINAILQDGFNKGIEHHIPYVMRRNLSENVYIFSGAKTYVELKELSELLLDVNSNIKPFSKFWQDVESIHPEYNQSYLQAEHIFATQSAQMASKWNDYESEGDRYNLQYRTAGDDRVRESHMLLHNTTLPPSDLFWNEYFPPNGWRCRCTTVQVRKSKYTESDSSQAKQLGMQATEGKNNIFRFNPGKQQVIFPEHHPYFKTLSKQDIKAIKKLERENESWTNIQTKAGKVRISSNHGKAEAAENIEIATCLADRHKYEIDLIGKIEGKKTADSFNKTLSIKQEYKTNKRATLSAIDNALRSAAKQSENIVLNIKSDIPDGDLRNAIQGRVKRTKDIESVTVIRNNNDKTYSRNEIAKSDWTL
jgi:SPP1 gp7 family putative phage head morphogenesis protein